MQIRVCHSLSVTEVGCGGFFFGPVGIGLRLLSR